MIPQICFQHVSITMYFVWEWNISLNISDILKFENVSLKKIRNPKEYSSEGRVFLCNRYDWFIFVINIFIRIFEFFKGKLEFFLIYPLMQSWKSITYLKCLLFPFVADSWALTYARFVAKGLRGTSMFTDCDFWNDLCKLFLVRYLVADLAIWLFDTQFLKTGPGFEVSKSS